MDYNYTKDYFQKAASEIGTRYDDGIGAAMPIEDSAYAHYRDRMEKKHLLRLVKLDKSMSVLDLGCGTGRWSIEFAKICKNVVAVDFADKAIEYAKKVAEEEKVNNLEYICQSIDDFSYLKNRHFDIIHAGGVLQYLDDESVENLVRELRHHLREREKVC